MRLDEETQEQLRAVARKKGIGPTTLADNRTEGVNPGDTLGSNYNANPRDGRLARRART